MFAKTITESDAFLSLSATSQMLYIHLNMNADDDGFVNAPKKIMRISGAKDRHMKELIDTKFIIEFDSEIVVIKHWRINNQIQKDRYKPTKYLDELGLLKLDKNGSYSIENGVPVTDCIQSVSKTETQVRLGKVSKGKYREDRGVGEETKRRKYDDSNNPELNRERLKELLERRGEA